MARSDYINGPGGLFDRRDGSGPYVIDAMGNATLIDYGNFGYRSSNASISSQNASITPVTLLAANPNRVGRPSIFFNGAAILYLLAGSGTPSPTNFTILLGSGYHTYWTPEADYTGPVQGVWDVATGTARMTEYVPS